MKWRDFAIPLGNDWMWKQWKENENNKNKIIKWGLEKESVGDFDVSQLWTNNNDKVWIFRTPKM